VDREVDQQRAEGMQTMTNNYDVCFVPRLLYTDREWEWEREMGG
jgi:hypothetical protein